MYKKILVPLDGSMRAEVVLRHAEEMAHRYGASVILLRVVELVAPIGAIERAYTGVRQQELDQQTAEAHSYLVARQGEFREKGIDAQVRVVHGPAVRAILKAAEDEGADLIAIASHGRSSLSRMFYGSVAGGLLQRADRPLLLIPARQ